MRFFTIFYFSLLLGTFFSNNSAHLRRATQAVGQLLGKQFAQKLGENLANYVPAAYIAKPRPGFGQFVGRQFMQIKNKNGKFLNNLPQNQPNIQIGRLGRKEQNNVLFNRIDPPFRANANVGKQIAQHKFPQTEADGFARKAMQSLRQRMQRIQIHTRMNILAESWEGMKRKAMFGFDEMPFEAMTNRHSLLPKHGHELIHVPRVLMESGKINLQMVRGMLTHTGRHIYRGIWRASQAIKQLPPAVHKTLLSIATIAEIGHTMDEYWQVLLLSYIDGDQVGLGAPRSLSELGNGLNNFWWDAWPDFAFGVPVALFAMNPPAAILTGAYFTLMEYVGKKVLGEALKDFVWTSEMKPVRELKKFTNRQVPKQRVFDVPNSNNDDGGDGEERKNADDNDKEKEEVHMHIYSMNNAEATAGDDDDGTTTVQQALLDSQVGSNVYKYFAINSMRSIYVLAVAVQVEFFELLDSKEVKQAPAGEENMLLSEFAQKTMEQMAKDKSMAERTKQFFANNEHVKEVMAMEHEGMELRNGEGGSSSSSKWLIEKAEEFEQRILPELQRSERQGNLERMEHLKKEIDAIGAQMPADFNAQLKPELLAMGKQIARFMVFRREGEQQEMPESKEQHHAMEWARTVARLIEFGADDLARGNADYMTRLAVANEYVGHEKNVWQRDEDGQWRRGSKEDGNSQLQRPKQQNDGKIVLPECPNAVTQFMRNYGGRSDATSAEMHANGKEVCSAQTTAHLGACKRWSMPFCAIGGRQSTVGQILSSATDFDARDLAGIEEMRESNGAEEKPVGDHNNNAPKPYQLMSVYDEEEVEELQNGFKLLANVLTIQRAWQKWRNTTGKKRKNKIGKKKDGANEKMTDDDERGRLNAEEGEAVNNNGISQMEWPLRGRIPSDMQQLMHAGMAHILGKEQQKNNDQNATSGGHSRFHTLK